MPDGGPIDGHRTGISASDDRWPRGEKECWAETAGYQLTTVLYSTLGH
jgi:hypothetical protein